MSLPQIPFLPGYTEHNVTKTDFRKPHSLGYVNGYAVKTRPRIGVGNEPLLYDKIEQVNLEKEQEELEKQLQELNYSAATVQQPSKPFIPAHVAFDKIVLSFNAYFKQTVHDSTEQFHLRKVRILVYVEDDSIAVLEPPQENSGIPQGVLIKRQRLPKNDSAYYTALDFNLSQNITFYGKTFHITSCDAFTEKYMKENLGLQLNPAEPMPVDPYLETRNRAKRNNPIKEKNDKLKKFLLNDRKVLRFYCYWDDRASMYGELREFVIHYYLVDDSVEVREVQKPNNGRDPSPILLRRQQLPKQFEGLDNSRVAKYTWRDFKVGQTINVLGRKMLIYNCDEYTRHHFNEHLGTPEEEMQPLNVKLEKEVETPVKETPPYNGFGSEEDSLGSCKYLVLKPPKKDFLKMLENEHKVLRYVARMISKHPEDAGRRFVIQYRLADDTMSIYEPPQRNAGILGGKFKERTRVLKPGHTLQNPKYYEATDLFIGAHIEVSHHKFVLIDADAYVFNYMESHADEFVRSNVKLVLSKVKPVAAAVRAAFSQQNDCPVANFEQTMESVLVPQGVSKHEIITLARSFMKAEKMVDVSRLLKEL